ncbi:MAG TPA: ImmA/IrrE family metallo-endopeptidase [Dermatophilaceae bacterium]|nr:ImmA/IrrE family metallo-endopeptidase [Dermatophilaceae bacterium]
MAERVDISLEVLRWARERSGRSRSDLNRFPVEAWEARDAKPTMRQLEEYAKATRTPIGFFFLREPPRPEPVPIQDFRRFGGDRPPPSPTPDLLDTIYACQARQDWYRDYAEAHGADPVPLVGSLSVEIPVSEAADQMRSMLSFGLDRRLEFSNWSEALTGLRDHAEEVGVLVMISGVVGANTHRLLNPEEFRGFALADDLAPVVFINGADTRAAQIFSLAHELAHISLGETAVSKPELGDLDRQGRSEQWCNEVAAELLVPEVSLRQAFLPQSDLTAELDRLAKFYRTSTLVVLRRLADVGLISAEEYHKAYPAEASRVLKLAVERASTGGSFYNTTPVRVSKRFARALIADTLEGRTSHREAYRLLGSRKHTAFEELGRGLGVA